MNLAVEADIANGTRGTIEQILLDARENNPEPSDDGTVRLRYPPAMILFRPDKPTDLMFEGIEAGSYQSHHRKRRSLRETNKA